MPPVATSPSVDSAAAAAATAFARDVAQAWADHLGARLVGIYLIGSLAHGGFNERYSDIDMALIVETLLPPDELDLLRSKATALSKEHAAKLSLFWADADFSVGRFPPLDRADLIDHAVTLIERRRVRPARPTLAEMRAYLAGEPFRGWSQQAVRFATLDELPAEEQKRYLRALLYPARLLYSWETGRMSSNDEAVAFVENRALGGPDFAIVRRTLECRNRGESPEALFAERAKLTGLQAICRRHMGL